MNIIDAMGQAMGVGLSQLTSAFSNTGQTAPRFGAPSGAVDELLKKRRKPDGTLDLNSSAADELLGP